MAAALLTPAAVLSFALGLWRLGCDLNWTGRFAISEGVFSHWQVWFAIAAVLQACASILDRYGRGGEATP
jgi:hypothetical protein